jgi:hypothetical protein
MSVLPPHQVRRLGVLAMNLEDLSHQWAVADVATLDAEVVSGLRMHAVTPFSARLVVSPQSL